MCAICGFEQCRDGCPNKAETIDLCPECGQECEKIYRYKRGHEPIGCDHCVEAVEADISDLCPECGEECETIYRYRYDREVIGCDRCVEAVAPEEAFWQ